MTTSGSRSVTSRMSHSKISESSMEVLVTWGEMFVFQDDLVMIVISIGH
jgi:hypothetical protein